MEIYNILIVDDEPAVVDSIKQLLDERANVTIEVFCAYSGVGALRLMQNHRIDIMFCDIRMPGISGLQLVEMVRTQWPICRIIMLTAYMDFEYSRKALQLGVSDYVLKSDKDDRILEGFHKCVLQFDQELAKLAWMKDDTTQIDSKLKVLQQNALQNLLHEQVPTSAFPELLKAMDYVPERNFYMVMACVTEGVAQAEETVIQSTEVFFEPSSMIHHCTFYGKHPVWLVQNTTESAAMSDMESRLNDMFELVAQYLQTTHKIVCHFVISYALTQADMLGKEASRIRRRADLLANDTHYIIWQLQMNDHKANVSRERTIEAIQQFVEQHIADDLTLTAISKAVGYNAAYCSRLYLSATGQNIRDYVAERKLFNIKELMKQSDLSLGAISRISGFESQSHMNRFIKRYTGQTPGELRETLLHK